MSRAVIDQAGFRVGFVGIVISLCLGLAIKSQISAKRIEAVIQESVSRLDPDFIIDFKSAEVRLSKWGLPLPFLEISQIRMSPKKSVCQDSQIFIEKLVVPLSLVSLFTSKSLVTDISASSVELRVAEVDNCLRSKDGVARGQKKPVNETLASLQDVKNENPTLDNFFQMKTSGLLNRARIDQLKLIYKKYPSQALDLRQVQLDFFYEQNKLEKIQLASQIYALKDPQSSVLYFNGELGLQIVARPQNQFELEAKLKGRILDGELNSYVLFSSLEQNLKLDLVATNVALKPFIQMNLIESMWLNYPLAASFQGYGQYRFGAGEVATVHLKNVQVTGEKTAIVIPEVKLSQVEKKIQIESFEAEIERLNLNKLARLAQFKGISQSIENFGEINGIFKFKNAESMTLKGVWSNLEFIFSNRGRREIQKLDSFKIDGKRSFDTVNFNVSDFMMGDKPLSGEASLQHNLKSQTTQAEAQISGQLLGKNVWSLLTGLPQEPNGKIIWTYKKSDEERHQISLTLDNLKTHGMQFKKPEVQMIQSFHDGLSSALALTVRSENLKVEAEELKSETLAGIFNSATFLNKKAYTGEDFVVNLKGPDWKNMTFEVDGKLLPLEDVKATHVLKTRGEWKENETLTGSLLIQNQTASKRYELLKKETTALSILPL